MEESRRLEIKAILLGEWDNFQDKVELAKIMADDWLIYGKYSNNEHYLWTEIHGIIEEIELELNPIDPDE